MIAEKNRTILVADDDPDIRRLVAFAMRRRGYEVVEAAAGDEALTLIWQHHPDLAVLDVMMPGMTGLDVARVLAACESTASMPVLLLSAKGQAGEIIEGLASGARDYVVKPFALPDLAARVAALLAP
jgi:two-component system response regulator MtrA